MKEADFNFANRIKKLPPYLFAEMEKIILEKKKQGVDLISLSIGDPDIPTPKFIVEALREEIKIPKNHNYSFSQGEPEFKQAVARWYEKRFKADLNPETEAIALIGSKEGIANITRAFINPGDRVLVPDPAYPVYSDGSTILSEGIPVKIPLLEENNFEPNLNTLNTKKVKIMFLNYPNNPTGATLERGALKKIVEFVKERKIILCYDNAYSEIAFDGYKAPSILEIEGGMDVGIEFHSCSKTFSMTGDRIGFAVGNKKLVEGLMKIKTQIDSGPPPYTQKVAIKALDSYTGQKPPTHVQKAVKIYQERRDIMWKELNSLGIKCKKTRGTFYLWPKCGGSSMEFTKKLLDVGVVVTPGIGFGKYGEGYVRISLTRPKKEIREACERIAKIL